VNEHDYEPIPGLPARLPEGEKILWQGAPGFEPLARRALHVRKVAAYFLIIAIWGIATRLSSGMPVLEVAIATGKVAGLAVLAEGVMVLFAWLSARSTLYTITDRRVVMRFGIAMPITIQIPFSRIESAGVRVFSDGAGDVSLSLQKTERVGYLVHWPHVRPWHFARAEPTFRAIPDAAAVAQTLGRALAAATSQPVTARRRVSVLADAAGPINAAA
jgi:hypothetical protein